MKKILVTGAGGTVGYLVMHELGNSYQLTPIFFEDTDVSDYETFSPKVADHDVIIHLAWDTKTENYTTGQTNLKNIQMTNNVYRAAIEYGVKRVIMASSVHADNFYMWASDTLMDPNQLPIPDSPYGASKVYMETLGRMYAQKHNLEVICIRLGGVIWNDQPMKDDPFDQMVWCSRRDCAALFKKSIDAASIPNNYTIVYGVSDNQHRRHDLTNPFGWKPEDGT
ncbi:NAD(P)-dependent oxidoreductase [candidate division WWE3 bacterium]|uniref:NAD(P)-dependent oxidoreductase n=1 Tax=candidate division WWE3 bacterium TaxID=2053526 RepID=A0A955LHA4_UNCKA|nr:NAD(P)-dependent oxidoreductase [candidate division WWE3 bacterium]